MKEEITQVPLDKIDFVAQVREVFEEGAIAGLAANMKEVGQRLPTLLFPIADRYNIEDGYRRCLAAKLLGWKTIAARITDKPSEAVLLLRQCSVDFQREDLGAMEKASAVAKLMAAANLKGNEVAAKLGVSPAMVTRLLALLTLPEPIRQALKEGRIPASAGYELAKIEDAALRDEIAKKLMTGDMTREEVAGVRKAKKREEGKPVKRVTACLEGGRTITVSAGTLDEFIAACEDALRAAKKSRTQGIALATFVRLLKDQAA